MLLFSNRSLLLGRLGVAAFLLALGGCEPKGPQIVPVSGVVFLDGNPVEGAALMFLPQTPGLQPATAATDAQGRFKLSTKADSDGAYEGLHKVTISLVRIEGVPAGEDGLEATNAAQMKRIVVIPERYGKADSSGLTQEVQAEMPPIEFKLTRQSSPAP